MRNVAVFGGSFNPVHWGHLLIAKMALEQFDLDQVIWVPTYRPPHKGGSLQMFEHRLEMVRRAIAEDPAFTVSDIEAQRQEVSYAIATLTDLQPLYPDSNWFWIIGSDAFQTLPQWHQSEALAAQCTWLVAPRSRAVGVWNRGSEGRVGSPLRWHLLEMPEIKISSSLIRQACQDGRSIRDWVPEIVRLYLLEFKLYAK